MFETRSVTLWSESSSARLFGISIGQKFSGLESLARSVFFKPSIEVGCGGRNKCNKCCRNRCIQGLSVTWPFLRDSEYSN